MTGSSNEFSLHVVANTLHVISHTHWDREWYLSHEQFRLRLVDLIDHLIDIMESDPDFRFFHLDGQTIVLEDYLEIRPNQRERLSGLIRSGRLLIGPWYLQNDEFLVLGESTVRNLLIGQRICRNSFGIEPMMVGYVPDQFGNVSQLPQILHGFNIDCAVFGRGCTGPDQRPEFVWRGADGSEVFAVFMLQWYNNAQRLPRDPQKAIQMCEQILAAQEGRAQTPNILLMNGVDHLEAQENLGAIIKEVNAQEPGFELLHSTLPFYIRSVRANLRNPGVVEGEFRSGDEGNVLSGTASSRVYLKMANFQCQTELLRWAEPFSVFAHLCGMGNWPQQALGYAWKTLIQCHPHDSICGCSIDEVHAQMEARFHRVNDLAGELASRALTHLAASTKTENRACHSTVTVFNPLPVSATRVVETTIETLECEDIAAMELVEPDGRPVGMQVLDSSLIMKRVLNPKRLPKLLKVKRHRVVFEAANVPPMGYATLLLRQRVAAPVEAPVDAGRRLPAKGAARKTAKKPAKYKGKKIAEAGIQLSNEHLTAMFNANGTLDIQCGEAGPAFRGVHYFEDIGDRGNEYIFMRPRNDSEITTEQADAELEMLETSDLRHRVRVTWKWKLPTEVEEKTQSRPGRPADYTIVSTFTLARGAKHIEVETEVNNTVKDHRLRVLFPTGLAATQSQADSAFDIVRRPFSMNSPNRNNQHPMESFFTVSDGASGVAVFSAGMPEFEVMERDTTMCLTLLRCVDLLGDMPPEFWEREQLVDDYTPGAQCQRSFVFRYGIYPYAGDAESAQVKLVCDGALAGMRAIQLPTDRVTWAGVRPGAPEFFNFFEDEASAIPQPEPILPLRHGFLSVADPQVNVAAVKFPETGWMGENRRTAVVRLVNLSSATRQTKVACSVLLAKAEMWKLSEQVSQQLSVAPDNSVEISVGSKGIVTLALTFAG